MRLCWTDPFLTPFVTFRKAAADLEGAHAFVHPKHERQRRFNGYAAKLIDVAGMEHAVCKEKELSEALMFIDSPLVQKK